MRKGFAVLVGALVMLSACGDDKDSSSSSTALDRPAGGAVGQATASPDAAPGATGSGVDQSVVLAQAAGVR